MTGNQPNLIGQRFFRFNDSLVFRDILCRDCWWKKIKVRFANHLHWIFDAYHIANDAVCSHVLSGNVLDVHVNPGDAIEQIEQLPGASKPTEKIVLPIDGIRFAFWRHSFDRLFEILVDAANVQNYAFGLQDAKVDIRNNNTERPVFYFCISNSNFRIEKDNKVNEVVSSNDMSDEVAQRILVAAIERSNELGVKMNIAIVDAGANLKAFSRMDGAWLGSIDIACKKAKTARFFDMPTGAIGEISQPGASLFNIEHSNGGLITFPGGVPVHNDQGEVIGAVGVSGSTVENDHDVAQSAVDSLKPAAV